MTGQEQGYEITPIDSSQIGNIIKQYKKRFNPCSFHYYIRDYSVVLHVNTKPVLRGHLLDKEKVVF
jgi:hypothetical protein